MSWPKVKLGELFKVSSGGTPSRRKPEFYEGGSIPWVKTGDLHNKYVTKASEYITQDGLAGSSARMYPKGTVLVAMYGATIGACSILGIDACTNQACAAFTPNSKVDINFLYYLLKRNKSTFVKAGSGGAQPNISATFLKEFEIPLPPLDEQKRIAAILDKADAIRRKRKQAIDLADDFLRSVFLDMFGDPVANPKAWEVKKVEDIAAKEKYSIKAGPFGSALKKEDYVESGYKIYGQEQVIKDDLEFGDYYIDSEKFETLKSCSINEGDMLISLVGSFGKISVVPNKYQKGIINPRLMKVKFDSEIANPWFMKFLLTTKEMLTKIANMSHGGTMGILNVGKVKELTVINPPLNLQMEFLNIQSHVKKTAQKFDETEIDNLFNSLSQKAFSGEQ